MFAVYSYIAPTVTDVGGLSDGRGPGRSCSPSASAWSPAPGSPGELADWSVFRSLLVGVGRHGRRAAASSRPSRRTAGGRCRAVFLITALGSVLVVNLQLRLMDVAGDAQTLGAAMNHASLNVANALGAWLGGLVIAAGFGYRAPALVGVALSVAGLAVILASAVAARALASAPRPPRPAAGRRPVDQQVVGRVVDPAGPDPRRLPLDPDEREAVRLDDVARRRVVDRREAVSRRRPRLLEGVPDGAARRPRSSQPRPRASGWVQ